MDGSNIQESEEDRGDLQTRGVNPDPGGSLTRKGRIFRYLVKKTRRQRKAIAKMKAEQDNMDGEEFGFTEGFVLCLPCKDKTYDNDIFILKCRPSRPLTDEGARTISKPLRTSEVEMNHIGSIQPRLVSADDDSFPMLLTFSIQ